VRDILVFTGTRADYGLLRGLIRELETREDARVRILVSGSHLDSRHGSTIAEVEADGFEIAARVPVWSGDDSAVAAAVDTGSAISRYARELERLAPELVVVLGDRLEAFAMASAAAILSIPTAHIHGGEITEGAMDDALRHSITKLSFLHLTTTDEHRNRVIQLGEEPQRVVNLGAPVVDALSELQLLPAAILEDRFNVRLSQPTAVMTFHPAAFDSTHTAELVTRTIAQCLAVKDLHVIITGTNTDIGSGQIREIIDDAVTHNQDRIDFVESLGQLGYLSVIRASALVIGNSSSTVLEAPVLGTPSVLVGNRQKGRPLSASVIVSGESEEAIGAAIDRALSAEFAATAARRETVFGAPGFAKRSAAFLCEARLSVPPVKRFRDVSVVDE
jgi:UDP-hydrolysing UDP-N-acetyl-D-glucosamine 2-epimerase